MLDVGRCKLPELLRSRSMTQRQLAAIINVSESQISEYANSRHTMSLLNAYLIAGALRCSIDDLYDWDIGSERGR